MEAALDKIFHLKEHHTNIKTEVIAGITTFMTMSYILAVNPSLLSQAGMDKGAVFTATALAGFVGTCVMAILSNYPVALAPGMGLNAYFVYTVVLGMGYTWQTALAAVLIEGILFIILSLVNVREAIFNAIPHNLKTAVSVGVGLYIAFIGLQNAKIVVDASTLVKFYSFKESIEQGTFHTEGITVVLAIIGILLTSVLVIKKVRGNILWGILGTWGLGVICQLTGLYQVGDGAVNLLPDFSAGITIPSLKPTFMQMDFSQILNFNFIVIMAAFLFVDLFDTLGALIAIAKRADLLDEEGKLPNIKGALLADAIATTVGAVLGTSTTTTFIESAAGVEEGGRTGLTSITTGILFLAALILSPIFLAIPSFATAPALIIVGFLMMASVRELDFDDMTETIPSLIAIIAMPFMYSISEGIAMGIISYVVINLITGEAKDKKISALMYVLAILFILKYIFL